jgi:hypothetical protein
LPNSLTALQKRVNYQFFPTHSGWSGEQKSVYYRFQVLNGQGVAALDSFFVAAPSGTLKHLDYRIWQEGLIAYEAKENSVAQRILDTVWSPHTYTPVGFHMHFPELEANSIIEIFYQAEGVAMPYHFNLADVFALQASEVSLEIISADPLQYKTTGAVQDTTYRRFDKEVYQFKAINTSAEKPNLGLPAFKPEGPTVYLRWKDLVYRYDRDEVTSWHNVLKRHFYRGPIKNYSVFVNSDADFLGRSIYWGSTNKPDRYYRYRAQKLEENFRLSWGQLALNRGYLNPLVELQEWTNQLGQNPKVDLTDGLAQLDAKVAKYLTQRFNTSYSSPYEFTDYALLAKFYLDFLEAKKQKAFYVLAKPSWQGPVFRDFLTVEQFSLLAVAYQNKSGLLQYKVVGPYLGQIYALNTWPPDFSGAQLLVHQPQEDSTFIKTLILSNPVANGIDVADQQQISFTHRWLRRKRQYATQGLFTNKMYQAYLQQDSAYDVLSFTQYQKENNAILSQQTFTKKWQQNRQEEDTFALKLPLKEALAIKRTQNETGPVQLPAAYTYRYSLRLKADAPFSCTLKPPWPKTAANKNLSWRLDSIAPQAYELKLRLHFKSRYKSPNEISRYLQLDQWLKQGLVLYIRKEHGA